MGTAGKMILDIVEMPCRQETRLLLIQTVHTC